jgi:hypothetical protein
MVYAYNDGSRSVRKAQPPVVLPYVNTETGLLKLSRPSPYEKIISDYSIYSHNYWVGVKKRQQEYRLLQAGI